MNEVVIAGAARTPMGGFQGMFDGVTAADLGGAAIRSALKGAGAETVDEVKELTALHAKIAHGEDAAQWDAETRDYVLSLIREVEV